VTKHLLAISAFWKNDQPDGIGITVDESFGDLDDLLFILQVSYNAMWAECQENGSLPDLINDLRAQLVEIGLRKPIADDDLDTVCIVIGNIRCLENHGHMISDEYNGLQLVYFGDSR
jgi:hypothetical protein